MVHYKMVERFAQLLSDQLVEAQVSSPTGVCILGSCRIFVMDHGFRFAFFSAYYPYYNCLYSTVP
jgi:hypothetical protein